MEIRLYALPENGNLVTSKGFSFVVQWLSDIPNKVDQKFEGLFSGSQGAAAVIDPLCLVHISCR